MSTTFNSITLVSAVQQLFELNNYQVEGPIKINGAEIDLVVTPLGDPFGRRIYIEVTVEYVEGTSKNEFSPLLNSANRVFP